MGAGKTPDEWDALKEKWQAKFNNNGHGNSLSIEAQMLPTPVSRDSKGVTLHHKHRGVVSGLPDVPHMLPTPRAMTGGGDNTAGQDRPSGHKGTTNLHGLLQDPKTDWGKYAFAIERWEAVLNRPAPDPTDGQGRLNPALVEWMMGYPEGWTEGVSRTGQLKALGNAIVPHQAAAAWGHLLGLNVFAEAGGASPADPSSIRRQRTRISRDRWTGFQDSDLPMIPTPTAWLGRRPSQSIGSADRWHDKARSRELSDFIAALVCGMLDGLVTP